MIELIRFLSHLYEYIQLLIKCLINPNKKSFQICVNCQITVTTIIGAEIGSKILKNILKNQFKYLFDILQF